MFDATIGGVWTIKDDSVATINAITGKVVGVTNGTTKVSYTVSNIYGCTASVNVPFTVSCNSVTSGGEGGLESVSIGDAVAKRVYTSAMQSVDNTLNYHNLPLVTNTTNSKYHVFGITTPGTMAVTDLMPSKEAIGIGFNTYDVSAKLADLPGFTNAQIIKAYDYVANNTTKSATLITKSFGQVYLHTKPICDRLKGATLLDVQTVTVQDMHFIQYKLLQATGETEYAISFSAGIQKNMNAFNIQSVWLTKNYIGQDTMYNYQIWAVTPEMVNSLLNNALNKLAAILPLQQINTGLSAVPRAYVTNIERKDTKLVMRIMNTTSSTNGMLQLAVRMYENEPNTVPQSVPVTLNANGITDVTVDIQDAFENDANLYVDGKQEDLAYMNDGNWNYSLSSQSSQPNSFVVSNDANIGYDSTAFRLLRNVSINVNTPDYVSVYKMMRAGGLSKDLTGYKNLLFTASATGAGQLKIVLQKASISNWSSQYTYTINISGDAKDYTVNLSDFTSRDFNGSIKPNDIVTATFSFIGNGSGNINANLNNVRFNTTDYVYEATLQSKEVSVYPNPARGNFNCSFKADSAKTVTMRIVDLSGRVVLNKEVSAVKGQNLINTQITNHNLKDGYYILVLQAEGERYNPFKLLIKQ